MNDKTTPRVTVIRVTNADADPNAEVRRALKNLSKVLLEALRFLTAAVIFGFILVTQWTEVSAASDAISDYTSSIWFSLAAVVIAFGCAFKYGFKFVTHVIMTYFATLIFGFGFYAWLQKIHEAPHQVDVMLTVAATFGLYKLSEWREGFGNDDK